MSENNSSATRAGITRARAIYIETRTSWPCDVTSIARAEIDIEDADYRIDAVQSQWFEDDESPCTPYDLAAAVNDPNPVDVLVCHDAARVLEVFPSTITGNVPWIATGRLLIQAYPGAPTVDLAGTVEWLGLKPALDAMVPNGPETARQCSALALVAHHVIRRLGLRRAITFSTYPTRPLAPPPTIDDDDGWAAMPACDVKWLATFVENAKFSGLVPERVLDPAISDRALREYNRRRIWMTCEA